VYRLTAYDGLVDDVYDPDLRGLFWPV
jgi:hypothetical protein